jgi:hypothetical protein
MDLLKAGKRVWLDKNMKDCSTAAMMEGVEDVRARAERWIL